MSQAPYSPYGLFAPPSPRGVPGQTETFLAYMQDGKIFRQAPEGPQVIGVTTKTHDDLQADYDGVYATCQEYYDALVKAGVIVPEPTQEDLLNQQAEQLKAQAEQLREASKIIADGARSQEALAGMINELRSELSALKGDSAYEHRAECHSEPAGPVAAVEADAQPGMGDNQGLPKLPRRSDAGDSRPSPQSSGPAKRSAVSAKRSGGRHS